MLLVLKTLFYSKNINGKTSRKNNHIYTLDISVLNISSFDMLYLRHLLFEYDLFERCPTLGMPYFRHLLR